MLNVKLFILRMICMRSQRVSVGMCLSLRLRRKKRQASIPSPPGGGGGYCHKVRIGVCREGS